MSPPAIITPDAPICITVEVWLTVGNAIAIDACAPDIGVALIIQ